jgi:hypothetical protein
MLPRAEMKNMQPAKKRVFFLPHPDAITPETQLPMMQPIKALAQVKPCQASE